jgi:hypothetical protein
VRGAGWAGGAECSPRGSLRIRGAGVLCTPGVGGAGGICLTAGRGAGACGAGVVTDGAGVAGAALGGGVVTAGAGAGAAAFG